MMKRFMPLLLAAAIPFVTAQHVIDFTKLPSCAQQQCTILQQADANCVPPAAPATDQAIYQSCVCQSALLQQLRASGALCQQAGCSPEDAAKISQYYISLCNGPVVQPKPKETGTTTSSTATGSPTAGSKGAAGSPIAAQQEEPSWIQANWRWVVFAVFLIVGIIVAWVGGIYLRRHFDRKREAKLGNLPTKETGSNGGTPPMASTSNTAMAETEMSGGRDGNKAFGVMGGPPPVSRRLSRSNTMGSYKRSSLRNSRTSLSQPVVWGPHQHLANGANPSSPPSPSSAIGQPQPFRNREAMRSDPRLSSVRSMDLNNPSPQETSRPHTAFGDPIRENGSGRRVQTATQSDPNLTTHAEGQSAEFCATSPPP